MSIFSFVYFKILTIFQDFTVLTAIRREYPVIPLDGAVAFCYVTSLGDQLNSFFNFFYILISCLILGFRVDLMKNYNKKLGKLKNFYAFLSQQIYWMKK